MSISTALILGGVGAVIFTVLALIFITPASKRDSLNPFFKFFHDLFNFKWLIIEKLLKFFYILNTLFCFCAGFFLLFAKEEFWGMSRSYATTGLILFFLGPIVIRLLYEALMMFVLLVKNVIELNAKTKGDASAAGVGFGAAPAPAPAAPEYVYCGSCGTRYDKAEGKCPNCGTPRQ